VYIMTFICETVAICVEVATTQT